MVASAHTTGAARSPGRTRAPSLRWVLSALVLLVGLALTTVATWRTSESIRAELRRQFEAHVDRLSREFVRRVTLTEYGLRGARGMVLARHGQINREEFRAYVASRDLAKEFPGVKGFGWIQPVPRDQLARFVADERADGAARFSIQRADAGPQLFVIRYIEPEQGNAGALGLNISSDPIRLEAVQKAIATGRSTLTAPVRLVQDPQQRPAWLLMIPVILPAQGAPQVGPGRLLGVLYAPIVADELLGPMSASVDGKVTFELHDARAVGRPLLFRGGGGNARPAGEPLLETDRAIEAGGRVFDLHVASTRRLERAAGWQEPWAFAAAGTALSILLALGAWWLLSAQSAAQARSRQISADLARMVDSLRRSAVSMVEVDQDLLVRSANDNFQRLAGLTEEEVLRRPLGDIFRPTGAGHDTAVFRQARPVRAELELLGVSGRPRWLDADIQPYWDDHSTVTGWSLVALDVTERKQAEQRLEDSRNLIRLMSDSIPARISYWDRDQRCRLANRELRTIYGLGESEIVGRHLKELLGPQRYALQEGHVQAVLGGRREEFELQSFDAAGRPRLLRVHFVPDASEGRVAGFFVFAIDVTELREAQDRAERASQTKSQFLSSMSHEIRTPMNGVLGMLALLRVTSLDQRQADYAAKAEASARSLLRLLNDILDFSKVEAGKLVLEARAISLETMFSDLSFMLAANLDEKSLALEFKVDEGLPRWLSGDDLRLRQILINLGGNAIKFTRRGRVSMQARLVQAEQGRVLVEFSVTDTGIGLSGQQRERIFEEFGQAHASISREFGGTGLGLAICRRLVELMGGQLAVDSELGHGSRFHFSLWLPIASPEQIAAAAPAPSTEGSRQPLAGLYLLLVEDNPINQQVGRELLEAAGARVEIAGDGRQGVLAVARSEGLDAVLMDVHMPVQDGYQATRDIRQKLMRHDLPIIAITANAMDSDREQCRQAGMNGFVGKPFMRDELIRAVLAHVGRAEDAPTSPAPTREPDAPNPVVDREAAIRRLGGEAALYRQLIPSYLEELRRAEEWIPRLAVNLPSEEAIRMVHTLKSTSATLGADALASVAEATEAMLRGEGAGLDAAHRERLADAVREVQAHLAAGG